MGRDLEIALYGLAKALESGVHTYNRRQDQDARTRERADQRKSLADYRSAQLDNSTRRAEAYERNVDSQIASRGKAKIDPARDPVKLIKEAQSLLGSSDPELTGPFITGRDPKSDGLAGFLKALGKDAFKDPSEGMTAFEKFQAEQSDPEYAKNMDRFGGAQRGKQVLQMQQKQQMGPDGNPEITRFKEQMGREPTSPDELLERQIQQTEQGAQQQQQGPPGPQPGPRMPGGQDQEQARMHGQAQAQMWAQAPQGAHASPADQMALGDFKWNYDLVTGRVPARTMEELLMAYQWFAQHTGVGRLPMDMDMLARGMGGQA